MSVQEIKKAVSLLPPPQVAELSRWLEEFQNDSWDKQIEADAKNGRLAHLISQAKANYGSKR